MISGFTEGRKYKIIKDIGGCHGCSDCPIKNPKGYGPCLAVAGIQEFNGFSGSETRDRMFKELYKIVFVRYVQEEMEL